VGYICGAVTSKGFTVETVLICVAHSTDCHLREMRNKLKREGVSKCV